MKQVTIYGNDIRPQIGSYVRIDGRSVGECLLAGDAPVDSGYRGCEFRLPTNSPVIKSVAVNIDITGRTIQWFEGTNWVKIKITFVGDCEPDTYAAGWLKVD
jgi:hypothetical protein